MQMLMTSPNHIPATRRMHVGKELEQFESIDWYDNEAQTTRYATWIWTEEKL